MAFAFQNRMISWLKVQSVGHEQQRQAFPSCKPVEDICVASSSLAFTQGRGRAHADGQEWDPIHQYRKPTASLGCPNTHRTKANKLEPSLEHSAKAVCQGEIPKDYGLEPRMWGDRIKEVHLKLPKFPSPIAMQCLQDWWEVATGLSVKQVSGQGGDFLWKNPGEWSRNICEGVLPSTQTTPCFHAGMTTQTAVSTGTNMSVSCAPKQHIIRAGSTT